VVTLKLNVICKRDNEIEEKEQEVADAIEESNRLRLEIDALQQYGKGMVENKDMSLLTYDNRRQVSCFHISNVQYIFLFLLDSFANHLLHYSNFQPMIFPPTID
jgi:hypothetical protein